MIGDLYLAAIDWFSVATVVNFVAFGVNFVAASVYLVAADWEPGSIVVYFGAKDFNFFAVSGYLKATGLYSVANYFILIAFKVIIIVAVTR